MAPGHISTVRRSRSLVALVSALAGVALVALLFLGGRGRDATGDGTAADARIAAMAGAPVAPVAAADSGARVPVTIFVMSRCPDAQYCESFLEPVLEPLKGVVRLRAEYIVREEEEEQQQKEGGGDGKSGGSKRGDGGSSTKRLACMHGPQECDGNKAQLCLQKRLDDKIAAGAAPADATVGVFLRFLTCGWKNPATIGTDDGTRACLAEAGWKEDPDAIVACAHGDEGEALLRASHEATLAAGATNSCTINVAGKRRCVRDGGRFKECEGGAEPADFKRTICEALGGGDKAAAVCK